MPAERLADVPGGTFGPYLGFHGSRTVAVWAARGPESDDKRHWYSVALDEAGERAGEPRPVAPAAADVGLVSVGALGSEPKGGFVVLSTARRFSGVRVEALALEPDGSRRGGPTPLVKNLSEVVWIDSVPTDQGALALWAIRDGDRARLVATELGPAGNPKGSPKDVLANARAWQAISLKKGALIAAVTAGKEPGTPGPVVAVVVDDAGRVAGKPITVSAERTAELDLDMVRAGGRILLAWSDRRKLDPRVYVAALDETGKVVHQPAPLTAPFGPQALIRLVSEPSSKRAFIAWENFVERPAGKRMIRVAALSPDAELGEATGLVHFAVDDGSMPEIEATSHGVSALTLAPACRVGSPCEKEHWVPTFVQFDHAFDVVGSEPLRLDELDGRAADLAWGLTCGFHECTALAARSSDPAPVFAVRLAPQSREWEPAGARYSPPAPPRPTTIQAIGQVDALGDLAAARVGQGTLAAWLTYFDPAIPYEKPEKPAPDGRYAPVRAILTVRRLPAEGDPPEAEVVSYRARSLGGVALSPNDASEALLVWTAIEAKKPQVFTTLLSEAGQKKRQRMLTHSQGEVADVAAAFVGDGWVIAWIDERDGEPEVYVTKVDESLRRVVPERRVTQAAGSPSQVRLLSRGEHVFAVWADARDSDRGIADLFTVRVSAKDASPLGPEQRLTRTAPHSHSPVLAPVGVGAVAAWIEETPGLTETAGAVIQVQRLDSGAEAASEPVTVAAPGKVRAVDLECAEAHCRLVAVVSTDAGAELYTAEFQAGDRPELSRLGSLSSPPRDAVAPVQVGSDLFYGDLTRDGEARVQWMDVKWE